MNLPALPLLFRPRAPDEAAGRPPAVASIDGMVNRASAIFVGFRPALIDLPIEGADQVMMYGGAGQAGWCGSFYGEYGYRVTFESATGAVREAADPERSGAQAFIDAVAYPLHTGQLSIASSPLLAVKILYCFGGLAPGVLSVSGFLIRRARTKARRRAARLKSVRPTTMPEAPRAP